MKILEVKYNNYLFRSKTEAKWARLLDELDIEYLYEPDTYVFEHINKNNKRVKIQYLPDFYLPKQGKYVEVKNNGNKKPTLEESLKAYLLALNTEKPVIIAFGDVKYNSNTSYGNYFCYHPDGKMDMHYRMTRCTLCNFVDFTKFGNVYEIKCSCTKTNIHKTLFNMCGVKKAFDNIQSYRFGW